VWNRQSGHGISAYRKFVFLDRVVVVVVVDYQIQGDFRL
jgi:hypothetical protein